MASIPEGIEILNDHPSRDRVLTPDALALLAKLHRRFNPRRKELLQERAKR